MDDTDPASRRRAGTQRDRLRHYSPPRKVVRDVRDGQPQYVYADPQTCKCLYVGDEQRYQKFQELSLQKKIADEQRSAARANWEASMNWWGGPWGW